MTEQNPSLRKSSDRSIQVFDPLAEMIGEYVRAFVHPKDRIEAMDYLYILIREARRTAGWDRNAT
jgi:hypothetical protein